MVIDLRFVACGQLVDTDLLRVVHVIGNINCGCDCADRTGYREQQEEGEKRRQDDGARTAEEPQDQRLAVCVLLAGTALVTG